MKNWFVLLLFVSVLVLAGGCSRQFSEEVVASEKAKKSPELTKVPLTEDFMPNLNFVPRSYVQTHVVLHFISNAAANPENPYVYDDIRKIFLEYEVSPHYMIDREGKIYALLPESRAARHSGKGNLTEFPEYLDLLNKFSIGIELMAIGTEAEMEPFMIADDYKKIPQEHIGYTEAQYKSLNLLLDDILARHKSMKKDRQHIIGHDQYAPGRKTDPGQLFDWTEINW